MLTSETHTIDGALADLEERIDETEERIDELDESTQEHESLTAARDRLRYFRNGLVWQRDEEEWGGDAEIELGALTAGEKAMMHREAPDHADREEMRIWFVAASTVDGPYHHDDLAKTFRALSQCHPAFVEWAEAQANGLGVPNDTGNRSSVSSSATGDSETSTDEPD